MEIRFTGLEISEVKIPFRFAFRHALAERKVSHALILKLRTQTGHVGYGEVLTRSYVTGETLESAKEYIAEVGWPALRSLKLPIDQAPLKALRPLYLDADAHRTTGAYAGLDIAAIDAWSRAQRQPVWKALGIRGSFIPLTAPIGGESLQRVRQIARLFWLLGFRQFKLKVGSGDDLCKVEAVKRIIGSKRDLRVDANGAWEIGEAIRLGKELRLLGVSSVEQPVAAGNANALARVQREAGIPVVADESLCTLADAKDLISERAAQVWNLRLAKIGGFSGALQLARLGERHGIAIQLGVLVGETSLLGAAARACIGVAPYRHVEFGFPRILLKADPFRKGPDGYLGTGSPAGSAPGLGVRAAPAILDRLTVNRRSLE